MTRQFFEASGRHCDFFEKTKNSFLDKVYGSMCTLTDLLIGGGLITGWGFLVNLKKIIRGVLIADTPVRNF